MIEGECEMKSVTVGQDFFLQTVFRLCSEFAAAEFAVGLSAALQLLFHSSKALQYQENNYLKL